MPALYAEAARALLDEGGDAELAAQLFGRSNVSAPEAASLLTAVGRYDVAVALLRDAGDEADLLIRTSLRGIAAAGERAEQIRAKRQLAELLASLPAEAYDVEATIKALSAAGLFELVFVVARSTGSVDVAMSSRLSLGALRFLHDAGFDRLVAQRGVEAVLGGLSVSQIVRFCCLDIEAFVLYAPLLIPSCVASMTAAECDTFLSFARRADVVVLKELANSRRRKRAVSVDGGTVAEVGVTDPSVLAALILQVWLQMMEKGGGGKRPLPFSVTDVVSLADWQYFAAGPVASIAAGWSHCMALSTGGGSVLSWGRGESGQLGHGGVLGDVELPRSVAALRRQGASSVVCGATHSLALLGDGTVMCWGSNAYGQLGMGDRKDRATPARALTVVSVDGDAAFRVKLVAAGHFHSALVSEDGQLWTWGWGRAGQLGHGAEMTDEVSPRLVDFCAGPRICGVALGHSHTVALADDGTVFAFGSGLPPRVVDAGGVRFSAVAAGAFHSVAVGQDGRGLWWWTGEEAPRRVLQAELDGSAIISVACGVDDTLVVTEDSSVFALRRGGIVVRLGGLEHKRIASAALTSGAAFVVTAGGDAFACSRAPGDGAYSMTQSATRSMGIFPPRHDSWSQAALEDYCRESPVLDAGRALRLAMDGGNKIAAAAVCERQGEFALAGGYRLEAWTGGAEELWAAAMPFDRDVAPDRGVFREMLRRWKKHQLSDELLGELILAERERVLPVVGAVVFADASLSAMFAPSILLKAARARINGLSAEYDAENHSIPDSRVVAQIQGNIRQTLGRRQLMTLSQFETHLAATRDGFLGAVVAFSCGHSFAEDDFHGIVLDEFRALCESRGVDDGVRAALLGEYSRRSRERVSAACPRCVGASL